MRFRRPFVDGGFAKVSVTQSVFSSRRSAASQGARGDDREVAGRLLSVEDAEPCYRIRSSVDGHARALLERPCHGTDAREGCAWD